MWPYDNPVTFDHKPITNRPQNRSQTDYKNIITKPIRNDHKQSPIYHKDKPITKGVGVERLNRASQHKKIMPLRVKGIIWEEASRVLYLIPISSLLWRGGVVCDRFCGRLWSFVFVLWSFVIVLWSFVIVCDHLWLVVIDLWSGRDRFVIIFCDFQKVMRDIKNKCPWLKVTGLRIFQTEGYLIHQFQTWSTSIFRSNPPQYCFPIV